MLALSQTKGLEPKMTNLLKRFANDESGATAIEYGLIATLIAIAIIGVAGSVGDQLKLRFTDIANALTVPAAK